MFLRLYKVLEPNKSFLTTAFVNTYSVSMCAFITHSCDTCREGRFQNKSPLKTEKHALKCLVCQFSACSESHQVLSKIPLYKSHFRDQSFIFLLPIYLIYLREVKNPAQWIDKFSQFTKMWHTAVMKVFFKDYGSIIYSWVVAKSEHLVYSKMFLSWQKWSPINKIHFPSP